MNQLIQVLTLATLVVSMVPTTAAAAKRRKAQVNQNHEMIADPFELPDLSVAEAHQVQPTAVVATVPAPHTAPPSQQPAIDTPPAPIAAAPTSLPSTPNVAGELPDDQSEGVATINGNCPFADGRCGKPMRANPNSIAAKIKKEADRFVAETKASAGRVTDAVQSLFRGHSDPAERLAQAAFAAAAKCRDFATFYKARHGMSVHRRYNSCSIFGSQNAYRSKGLCSQGVREALSEGAGIRLTPGNASSQKPKLLRAGLVRTAYQPFSVPNGTVLVCDGGRGHNYGHIEIVTQVHGERRFCSDFCSLRPTCNDGYHRNPVAYKFPGS